MPTEMPWWMAIGTNAHKCMRCYDEGKMHSLGMLVVNRTGLTMRDKGYWRELRKEIVEHYKKEHPEYKITRLREGNK